MKTCVNCKHTMFDVDINNRGLCEKCVQSELILCANCKKELNSHYLEKGLCKDCIKEKQEETIICKNCHEKIKPYLILKNGLCANCDKIEKVAVPQINKTDAAHALFCTNCGRSVSNIGNFCGHCGNPLMKGEQKIQNGAERVDNQVIKNKDSNAIKIIKIIAASFLLLWAWTKIARFGYVFGESVGALFALASFAGMIYLWWQGYKRLFHK